MKLYNSTEHVFYSGGIDLSHSFSDRDAPHVTVRGPESVFCSHFVPSQVPNQVILDQFKILKRFSKRSLGSFFILIVDFFVCQRFLISPDPTSPLIGGRDGTLPQFPISKL